VLVGLSGGSDSVALTLLLRDLAKHGEFQVVGAAHLHHGLRATADRDELFCRDFAARHALALVVETADVQSFARAQGLSIEEAARRVRYTFLERTAVETGADRVAIGHTQDDQAETLLLKLMRGAGLTGLAGIYPQRGITVRPLLDVSDAELQSYLRSRGEAWVEDETNADLGNPRNRIRHRVLPELDLAAGGSTLAAIARAAALIREDAQWLDELSRERFNALAVRTERGLELDARNLAQAPPPVVRRVVRQAMRTVAGGKEIGLDHVDAVVTLLGGGCGGVDVPGSRVELCGEKLVLIQQGEG
jgi:tRNA(Ile)-lysidine synthase